MVVSDGEALEMLIGLYLDAAAGHDDSDFAHEVRDTAREHLGAVGVELHSVAGLLRVRGVAEAIEEVAGHYGHRWDGTHWVDGNSRGRAGSLGRRVDRWMAVERWN